MAQSHDPARPPIGQRRCPKCGLPMFLSEIEAIAKDHADLRTFECQQCSYAETFAVDLL
jgi:ribosomal protein S27AE